MAIFRDQPKGLPVLFFTEMWERFSYYGMRGILILYMTDQMTGLKMDTATAAAIYGLYTAGVYLFALPGGWIADNLIGQRKAVFSGGVLIALGLFSMSTPLLPGFYLGLILIVLGTGLLKPNVSTIVGDLYPEGGARRDAGFSIFYMGINLGAFIGPLVTGYLGENIDWHLGFAAAGVCMVLGVFQFKMHGKYLGEAGHLREQAAANLSQTKRNFYMGVGGVVLIAVIIYALHTSAAINLTLQGAAEATGVVIISLAVLFFSSVLLFGHLETAEKKRVVVIFFLFIGAALFWSGFEQAGSSMNLFARDLTNRVILGWEAPASWLQSVNPIFIVLLAPVFGSLWLRLGQREPSIPAKFGLGLVQLGGAFFVLAWGASFATDGSLVSPMWLIVTYFLQTTGELCLSPVGLSSITKLSPKKYVGQMMGTWFMGAALGNLIAGLVARQFGSADLQPSDLFGYVALISVVSGILFLIFTRGIKRLIGDVK